MPHHLAFPNFLAAAYITGAPSVAAVEAPSILAAAFRILVLRLVWIWQSQLFRDTSTPTGVT